MKHFLHSMLLRKYQEKKVYEFQQIFLKPFFKFLVHLLHYPHRLSQITVCWSLRKSSTLQLVSFLNLIIETFLNKQYTLYRFCLKKVIKDGAHLLLEFYLSVACTRCTTNFEQELRSSEYHCLLKTDKTSMKVLTACGKALSKYFIVKKHCKFCLKSSKTLHIWELYFPGFCCLAFLL